MKIDDLKQEYDNIYVPEEAKERMRRGIEQAKGEKKVTAFQSIVKRTGVTAAAAVVAMTVMVNVSPTVASAMEQIPLIGSIAKVVTFRDYKNETGKSEADIKVPQIEGDRADIAANKSIEEYAQALIDDYEKELTETSGEAYHSVTSDYDVVTDTKQYLSIRINTTLVSASAMEMHKIFTIDKATGNVVSLKELTAGQDDALTKISQNIEEQMRAQMAADENVMYFIGAEEEGFTGLTGEESFYLNQDGNLVISFDEYEVAPGYMGAVEFTIPQEVFSLAK